MAKHLMSPCRACGQREAGPGFCGPCGKEAQEDYEANAKRLAIAEARAAYWKAEHRETLALIGKTKRARLDRAAAAKARDEAMAKLQALGAEP